MEAAMQWRTVLRCGLALALVGVAAASAGATTLQRVGLEELVASNGTIVVGEVVDVHSYWNDERTFILSDVRVAVDDVLKGDPKDGFVTLTVLGGTVDDTTVLIVGGPELVPGQSYVLFTQVDSLPGASRALTLRDHAQGVFDVVRQGAEVRAVSQASRQPLVPDVFGLAEPPGGVAGVSLPNLVESVRRMAGSDRGPRHEVKQ
ncbi:MAG TPA: hypothetical protein VHQ65_07495 [Thermoanaerobaculia bacterium]|nr:hypothetical protein [Thermoanaerobaculia bacterium]